jgi:hypothetical protein
LNESLSAAFLWQVTQVTWFSIRPADPVPQQS